MKKVLSLLFVAFAIVSVAVTTGCDDGNDKAIKVYTRESGSGTRDGFFTAIGLDDVDLASSAIPVDSNGSMLTSISNDEYGIGYVSLASLSSKLKAVKYNGVEATEENVLNGTYELKRNFNYIVRTEFTSDDERQIVEAFQVYLTTREAKTTMQSEDGLVSIDSSCVSWDDIKANYPITEKDNSSITIKFGGSTSVEKMAKALSAEFSLKCGGFITEHIHTGSGDAYKRTQGSEKDGANKIHIGFASREFKSSEEVAESTTGFMCIDAIVVVVNNENTVTNLTTSTLKEIYSGTINKWSEVE